MEYYSGKSFIHNGKQYEEPNVLYLTDILKEKGLVCNNTSQKINDIRIYPREYFCPNPYERARNRLNKSTYAVHYLDSSWRSLKGRSDLRHALKHETYIYRSYEKLRIAPQRLLRKIIGDSTVEKIKAKLKRENNG